MSITELPIPLLDWYRDNARDLPWRKNLTAYRVWISEIMLQQTRVTAVIDYYARFMDLFPTVEDLAAAQEDQLMKCWQGLGYYSRARNLHKAAKKVVDEYGGEFPDSMKELRSLPGIGDYTAAAIGSIVFGLPEPAVDGNLLRVTARIVGDEGDITSPAVKKRITSLLKEIIPIESPGQFNQAMMDLGAMICIPNGAPLCDNCPARGFCEALRTERIDRIPYRAPKKKRRIEDRTVWLFFYNRKVAIRRRPNRGLLAGLWEFPGTEGNQFPEGFEEQPEGTFVGAGRHIFSHVEWHMTACKVIRTDESLPDGWVWADWEELQQTYAIPSAFAQFMPIVEEELH